MTIHDCIQGTPQWHALRLGKLTASHAQAIATQSKGLETLCRKLAYEFFTGAREEGYKNAAMQLGNDDEAIARSAYELETGLIVEQVGFVEYNDFVGFSPDGLIPEKSMGLELKRQNQERHGDLLIGISEFDSGYIWQCRMGILIMGYDVWSLCSYNPSFFRKSLFVKDIILDKDSEEMLLAGFAKGEDLIKRNLEILHNN